MSKQFNVSNIALAADGSVQLLDAELAALEQEITLAELVARPRGGGFDESCSLMGCYNDLCAGYSDGGCENGITCQGSLNAFSDCWNDSNCLSTSNDRCHNAYTSGCAGTNGVCDHLNGKLR
jgi:hypothetical protein